MHPYGMNPDPSLEAAYQTWCDRLRRAGVIKPSKTIAICEEIVGGASVAKQIALAAENAHHGEHKWAQRARERAGYG